MMKPIILVFLALAAVSAEKKPVHPETKQSMYSSFTYNEGSTAAYTPNTGLIYTAGTTVKYVGGTTVVYPYGAGVNFPLDSQFYSKEGPVDVVAGSNFTFNSGAMITFPPGTVVSVVSSKAETIYQQFNGNSHTIVQYPYLTKAQYRCQNCNNILFNADTNPLVYYNPGSGTQFGPSALPVETPQTPPAQTRTYGYYGGGGGYSYCSGYSYNGYPRTTYYNANNGYTSTCTGTGYGTYSYSSSGGGYAGAPSGGYGGGGGGGAMSSGYSMAGGSCYGGGSYYGGYSGGYYG